MVVGWVGLAMVSADACAGHEGAMDLLSGIATASGGCAERM